MTTYRLIIDTCMLSMLCLVLLAGYAILIRDDVIAGKDGEIERLHGFIAEADDEERELRRQIVQKDASIGGHLADSVSLLQEIEWLKRSPLPDLDAQAVVADAVALIDAEWEARGVA